MRPTEPAGATTETPGEAVGEPSGAMTMVRGEPIGGATLAVGDPVGEPTGAVSDPPWTRSILVIVDGDDEGEPARAVELGSVVPLATRACTPECCCSGTSGTTWTCACVAGGATEGVVEPGALRHAVAADLALFGASRGERSRSSPAS